MDYRGVVLISVGLASGLAALLPGCSSPDPGFITYGERQSTAGAEPPATSDTADAGAKLDPIFGDSLMVWVSPGQEANNADPLHAGTVEGKDCVTAGCHLDNASPFSFAGTVYSTPQGGATVAKAEVRVNGPDGKELAKAYTDANGNFWFPKGPAIPANSKVGVRKEGGGAPRAMITTLQPADGGCNSAKANCHGTAGTGKVYVN